MPYRTQQKIVKIEKELDFAAHLKRIASATKDKRKRKESEESDRATKKASLKLKKIESKYIAKFDSKHWPKALKFLEKYAAGNYGHRSISMRNLLTGVNSPCPELTKKMFRYKLKKAGFILEGKNKRSELISW